MMEVVGGDICSCN